MPELRFPEFTDEWNEYPLSEICTGFDYGMGAAAKSFDGENKYIRITDIDDQTHKYIDASPVSPNGVLEEKYIVRNNDILFARTGASVGKTYKYNSVDGKLYFAGFLIRANVKSSFNADFIFANTLTSKYDKWVKSTSMRSGQPGINSQEYGTFKVMVPTLHEQNRIASLIELIDKRITSQLKLIEVLKLYKRGALQKVFCNFESLKYVALSSICEVKKGFQLSKVNMIPNGNYYVLNGGVSPSGYTDSFNCQENTISISEGGNSCGFVNFNIDKFWSGGHCYTLENVSGINLKYLYQYLKFQEPNIMALRVGSGLPNIQKSTIEKFQILLLPDDTQNTIGNSFFKIDKNIFLQERKLEMMQQFKRSLLQKMFI